MMGRENKILAVGNRTSSGIQKNSTSNKSKVTSKDRHKNNMLGLLRLKKGHYLIKLLTIFNSEALRRWPKVVQQVEKIS